MLIRNIFKRLTSPIVFTNYQLRSTWALGFVSFIGLPALVNALTDKPFSVWSLLTIFALIFFVPEKIVNRNVQITQEELDYYREKPEEIALINNATRIRYRFLSYAFILGFILVVVSKLTAPLLGAFVASFWVNVLVDLFFELGVALWGGAITTYIIELHALKEEKDCKRKQDEIRRLLHIED